MSRKSIAWVPVRHEEVAAFAAGAEAHLTEQLAVSAGSCAPGNLHLIMERFWADFYALSDSQKETVRRAWKIFRRNPFDARLGTHKIHRLSAHYGKTIYSVVVEGDLRVLFYIEGDIPSPNVLPAASRNC